MPDVVVEYERVAPKWAPPEYLATAEEQSVAAAGAYGSTSAYAQCLNNVRPVAVGQGPCGKAAEFGRPIRGALLWRTAATPTQIPSEP